MMIDELWFEAAYSAAQRFKAFDPKQVVQMMKAERVLVSHMDEWCSQARWDYPCMYQANVFEGIGQ